MNHYHTARVYLAQARYFRTLHRAFFFTLLQWAANARKREASKPRQLSLFLEAA